MVLPSEQYKLYEQACGAYIPEIAEPFTKPVNVKCVFYMPTKRKVDLSNLISAILDILVKYGVLADDNRDIAAANDGSRVLYDKHNPRCEIEITLLVENYEQWKKE